MLDRVLNLVWLLRENGVTVSTPEIIDALTALTVIPVYDENTVKSILMASLIKNRDLSGIFDQLFEKAFQTYRLGQSSRDNKEFTGEAGDNDPATGREGTPGAGNGGGPGGTSDSGENITYGNGKTTRSIAAKKNNVYLPGEQSLGKVPFIAATNRQKRELLALIRQLSKKMAAKKGTRHERKGQILNFRKLWRNSMASGGVPLQLTWQRRRYNKPRLFLICDFSNSMTGYLPFVLEFVFTFASAYSTVKVFGFVDSLEEITSKIDPVNIKSSVEKICSEAKIVRRGMTDYGNAFKGFYRNHRNELTGKSVIIVVGDGRNNYFDPGTNVLEKLRNMVLAIYWLNPEDKNFWGMGDSFISVYQTRCDGIYECKNLSQLRDFVDLLTVRLN
ncbi:VWA domain-containing protein [Desulfotruncus alcoholivorax]|uniref:VWA domain-containing protein n=1 Tax=Desulfotruncus alcoholivorax TaxID=265477 RepID=UPI000417E0BB|nr:VWA domain-containing protein [Desulfotruncus alcoholivorax]